MILYRYPKKTENEIINEHLDKLCKKAGHTKSWINFCLIDNKKPSDIIPVKPGDKIIWSEYSFPETFEIDITKNGICYGDVAISINECYDDLVKKYNHYDNHIFFEDVYQRIDEPNNVWNVFMGS